MSKEYIDVPFEIKSVDEDGTFEGLGSTFGGVPDDYDDIVNAGAFKKTLRRKGRNKFGIAMLWQHNSSQIPGAWLSMKETKEGLYVKGKLALKTTLGHDVYELMSLEPEPAVKGMSIGYTIPKGGSIFDGKTGIRYLNEIDLWELSIVTFPANISAVITNVKDIEGIRTERELEAVLRDSGLSRKSSQYIVSMCRGSLRDLRNQENNSNLKSLIQSLETATNLIKPTNGGQY